MRHRQFFVAVGVLLCVGLVGSAVLADARMFKKKDSRPRALIAVRDESLALQNKMIDRFCLVRFDDKKMLDDYIREPEKFFKGKSCAFVPRIHTITTVRSEFFHFANFSDHYAILSASNFMAMFGKEFYEHFHKKFKITDTLRTRDEQGVLVKQKKTNADGSTHERESAHLAGVAFDISKKNFFGFQISKSQVRWLEQKLMQYMQEEKIIVVEEQINNTFHVVVYPDWENK